MTKRGAPLYIICEKSQLKSLKSSDFTKDTTQISFLPVDIHEVRDAKNSFKKLCKACIPSSLSNELTSATSQTNSNLATLNKSNSRLSNTNMAKQFSRNSQKAKSSARFNTTNEIEIDYGQAAANSTSTSSSGFYKQLHESKWFEQLQTIINVSNLIVDRLEELSSVIVALEDGWDFTTQVTSLAELFLDPYYRTLEGFSVLVEREWLSMGHRFTRRNNHTVDDQTGFAPTFMQFLDVVHQCINQYPNAFEFNEFYLEFLAYHSVSNRFKTFLLDNECERFNFGLLTFSNNTSSSNSSVRPADEATLESQYLLHSNVSYSQAASIPSNTTCIWQYIQKVHYNSAKFFNFNYQPNVWHSLRPSSSLYKLKLWRYYTKETLCTGPVYDLDLLTIGNLNYNPSMNRSNTINANSSSRSDANNDEFWYPVPIKNANDYYEQLDQILPTQYEILLKQIMRKYSITTSASANLSPQTHLPPTPMTSVSNASSTCATTSHNPTSQLISSILANAQLNSNVCHLAAQNTPLNWKNVWDYFYQTVESKIIKDYLTNQAENISNYHHYQQQHLMQQQLANQSKSYVQLQRQLSTPSSSSMIPPPFPTIKTLAHDFEESIFSSNYVCCYCGGTFKSTTQFVGLKCKNCTMSFHEECIQNRNFTNECHLTLTTTNPTTTITTTTTTTTTTPSTNINNNTTNNLTNSEWNVNSNQINENSNLVIAASQPNYLMSIPQLEISSYSMQTTSSCSTSPNSYYSQNLNSSNRMTYFNSGKLDIGSACGKYF